MLIKRRGNRPGGRASPAILPPVRIVLEQLLHTVVPPSVWEKAVRLHLSSNLTMVKINLGKAPALPCK